MGWADLASFARSTTEVVLAANNSQQLTGAVVALSILCLVLASLICCSYAAGCLTGALLCGGGGFPPWALAAAGRVVEIGIGPRAAGLAAAGRRRLEGLGGYREAQ